MRVKRGVVQTRGVRVRVIHVSPGNWTIGQFGERERSRETYRELYVSFTSK